MMRRTHTTDVLECSQCHGRLHVLAAITEPNVAREILTRLGLAFTEPRPALLGIRHGKTVRKTNCPEPSEPREM